MLLRDLPRTENASFNIDNGNRAIPFTGALAIATPAAPHPRSRRTCVTKPPNPYPIMIGGRFEFANDLLVMIDNFRQSKARKAARIATELFNIAFHAGPVRGNDAITFVRVVFDPVLPTERGHPQAVDENNRGDVHCAEAGGARESFARKLEPEWGTEIECGQTVDEQRIVSVGGLPNNWPQNSTQL